MQLLSNNYLDKLVDKRKEPVTTFNKDNMVEDMGDEHWKYLC